MCPSPKFSVLYYSLLLRPGRLYVASLEIAGARRILPHVLTVACCLFGTLPYEFVRIHAIHVVLMQMHLTPLTPPYTKAVMQIRLVVAVLAFRSDLLKVALDTQLTIILIVSILSTRGERTLELTDNRDRVGLPALAVMPMIRNTGRACWRVRRCFEFSLSRSELSL